MCYKQHHHAKVDKYDPDKFMWNKKNMLSTMCTQILNSVFIYVFKAWKQINHPVLVIY